jgi:putative oxidoreductase
MTRNLVFNFAGLLGRLLLAALFIWDGFLVLSSYSQTVDYMESNGVPGLLLPLALIVQLGGGLLILIGWQTRLAALALAGFCLITAVKFHTPVGDMNERIHFWKDLGLAGGFLVLFALGAPSFSLDARSR